MKRVKKPKNNGKLSRKQKDEITWFVIKKLFPRIAALLLTAVQDVLLGSGSEFDEVLGKGGTNGHN